MCIHFVWRTLYIYLLTYSNVQSPEYRESRNCVIPVVRVRTLGSVGSVGSLTTHTSQSPSREVNWFAASQEIPLSSDVRHPRCVSTIARSLVY